MGVFDQYNQSQKPQLGPENDYQQALGMLGKGGGGGSSAFPSYDASGKGVDASQIAGMVKGAMGTDPGGAGPGAASGASLGAQAGNPVNQLLGAGAGAGFGAQAGAPMPAANNPSAALGMVSPKSNPDAQWVNYGDSGGSGGGGGGGMGDMASIAAAFI